MIRNWKHKVLRLFFENGVTSGIQVKHKNKLKIILQLLDVASKPDDLDLPGMRFHSLSCFSRLSGLSLMKILVGGYYDT